MNSKICISRLKGSYSANKATIMGIAGYAKAHNDKKTHDNES